MDAVKVMAREYIDNSTPEKVLSLISKNANQLLSQGGKNTQEGWERDLALELASWREVGMLIVELNKKVNNLDDTPTIVA